MDEISTRVKPILAALSRAVDLAIAVHIDEHEARLHANHDPDGRPLLLTITEAAAALRCSRKTVESLIRRGKLRVVMLGESHRRVPVAAVRSFVEKEAQRLEPAPVVLRPVRKYTRRTGRQGA